MNFKKLFTIFIIVMLLASCSSIAPDREDEQNSDGEENLLTVADKLVLALQEKDLPTFSDFAHPTKGVRFSPYAYVDSANDRVFSSQELPSLLDDSTVFHWGSFDGTGEPIEMTFSDYFERFIYDQDYVNATMKEIDERIGQGNSINNIADVYPNAYFVEYHFPGFDPKYEGMDWRSLRLVFEKEGNNWYVVAVIHDEWTI